ncbi:hypothetical protein BGZ76_004863 [Entomortierella beljakovae]|nr:hypothetical protein BGZ76_004863 [Entomortierella beljakovae]
MSFRHSTTSIQKLLVRPSAACNQGAVRSLPHPQRSLIKERCAFYSTNNSIHTPKQTSIPGSPSADTARSNAMKSSGAFSKWIRRLSVISISAAGGALAYSKLEPQPGLKDLPFGKSQVALEPLQANNSIPLDTKISAEVEREIKKSVVLEAHMQELEQVLDYKVKVKEGEWTEADPYWFLTKATEPHHLLAGTLRGDNMLAVRPLKFERKDKKAIVLFFHLGRSLCGHDTIVHGGLLATLLDDATGMVALPNLPYHIGFTANLNINYRKPVKADQFVMVTAEFEKSEGRKGYTKAVIYDLHGNPLTECTALFVSPKNPVSMVASYVKNSLGF